jgi:Flp pilus assembly protein TadG
MMSMRNWKRVRREEGSAIVEMAMASIVFLLVLIGTFETFMAVYSYHYISYAAREGARYAIVRGSYCSVVSPTMTNCNADQAAIQTHVYDLNFPGINVNKLTVTVSWLTATTTNNVTTWSACGTSPTTASSTGGFCDDPGNQVQVKVSYTNPLNIPFTKAIPLNLSSTATMVISD